ncbi:hypothetical protein [Aureimonas phyllosphaerae]|uniref:Uncharacterized protein n=1 Tax=Aureimonas phyllosphaerae TaxID=1166078 RepID=A0A7W6FWS3_9HYPH|nr:hypothetical protein [Aureimonas phyllosphaerae]MBB3937322.1 hypothetical protein [Aureimonas phyllosphaerae]MBB3961329.1 hypothetical protein [Aureimonas phyllosphaerae]SFF41968.1 hypothetical protein SAMN05216566_11243 [Aureimonas phyllosphaerae]
MPVFLTPTTRVEALDHEIETAAALLRDLRYLRDHHAPSADMRAGAPVLAGWSNAVRLVPCLRGKPVGHPTVRDGRDAVTSPLRVVSLDDGYVRTESRFWLLGSPATGVGHA